MLPLVYHKLAKLSALCYDGGMIKLLATPQTPQELDFFRTIAELLRDDVMIDLWTTETAAPDLVTYAAHLVLSDEADYGLPQIKLTMVDNGTDFYLPSLALDDLDARVGLRLGSYLMNRIHQITRPALADLPLQATVTDTKGQLIYHNQKPKDPFLPDDIEQEPVPAWLVNDIQTRPERAVHLLLPSTSFEQILMESYQGLYHDGEFKGIFHQVQDIKPLLASYLQDTGQAIVGWSDTVSGASIKNDLFEDDF